MPPISPEKLKELQDNPDCVRNICILAHVDHGKTSLSDCLLASNGIISQRMAGKVRYLDSREDEQIRGITMESSAISLYFKVLSHSSEGDQTREHLINLIDSPGHIDFSSEVSTASRLCDGALVLVDVVEGVCSQTVTVLRQAYMEQIKPILVMNKMDRLITELKLTPMEAYVHLSKLLEKVNAVMGSFFASERMEQDETEVEMDDEHLYFSPEANNVIFASAIDGWGFTIQRFAVIYEKKLGMKRAALEKCLWGDYYLDTKAKKVITSKALKGRSLKPMFVQFVLDNIWAVYDCTMMNRDIDKTEKVVTALGVKVLPRDMRSKDTKLLLTTIFSQWLPLSSAVLVTVIDKIPAPTAAQKARVPTILESAPHSDLISAEVRKAMLSCDASGPVSAYVSKMVAIPEEDLPKTEEQRTASSEEKDIRERVRRARQLARQALGNGADESTDNSSVTATAATSKPQHELSLREQVAALELAQDDAQEEQNAKKEVLIGFSRIYSGTLHVGDEVYVLGPKYDPRKPNEHIHKTPVTALYLMMGRELVSLESVPSGNVVGIGGLEGSLVKSGSIFGVERGGVNLAGVSIGGDPIVRVALEPEHPSQLPQLEKGLRLLNQADPCVRVILQETGEHVLLTAGELHLERCLKDLRERYARVEIQSSQPIVPYRETIVRTNEMAAPKSSDLGRGGVVLNIVGMCIKLRIRPLPKEVTELLITKRNTIQKLRQNRRLHNNINKLGDASAEQIQEATEQDEDDDLMAGERPLTAEDFRHRLEVAFGKSSEWSRAVDKICVFGPKHVGPNMLMDYSRNGLLRKEFDATSEKRTPEGIEEPANGESTTKNLKASSTVESSIAEMIVTGFELATAAGPLCAEPLEGVACIVESVESADDRTSDVAINGDFNASGEREAGAVGAGRASGQIIAKVRGAIRQGFLDWSPRIMLAMYSIEIQAPAEVLGRVYSVIGRRRGRIASEEMKEGTPFFNVRAFVPVTESFGLSEELRKRTSGAASPQLIFAGFEILDEDPFWVPTTEEELEDLGEIADRENIAKKYMDAVRRRKGLFVEEKLVKNAEKQRTLKR
ncbi:P-loop containing nucleoside triphosphate hydrolase protein [Dipodascopsis uninucleata]